MPSAAEKTPAAQLAAAPSLDGSVQVPDDGVILQRGSEGVLREMIRRQLATESYVDGAATALETDTPAGGITADYDIDVSAGVVWIGGKRFVVAALDAQAMIGATTPIGLTTAGETPASLAADTEVQVAVVAARTTADPNAAILRAVFGTPAASSSVAPSAVDIYNALNTSGIANIDPTCFVVVGRLTITDTGGTPAYSHIDPGGTDTGAVSALIAERGRGYAIDPDVSA